MPKHLLPLSVTAATVTAVAYLPEMLSTTGEQATWPLLVNLVCLGAIFVAAPAVVAIARRSARTSQSISGLGAALQVPVALLVLWLDIRVEIAQGYYTADSSEAAMAYGAGSVIAAMSGLVLAVLVWIAARVRQQ